MANTTQPTTEYTLSKDSYVAFDAISLRNLIIQRLNDTSLFTDQNYIGSNLASIIDIISYAFNSLIFYLHQTSNEATFTEAQLYENITKIVRLLDYKPVGFQTSTLSIQATALDLDSGFYTIPRYSFLQVGSIPFSFTEDITFDVTADNEVTFLTDISNKKLLYQGTFKEHSLYTATGDYNETIIIDTQGLTVDHFNLDVYVYENRYNKWIQYTNVAALYNTDSYGRFFEKRLTPNKEYEIVFGDNINGKRLEQGDLVQIYYLQSNGESGVVGPNTTQTSTKSLYNSTIFKTILNDVNADQNFSYITNPEFSRILFDNIAGSTMIKDIEDVESIKTNAPSNFKSQYRLVTKQDYETFIKINFANFVSDVKVFDNWDYTGVYLKYFKDIQVSPTAYKQIVFNQIAYGDSCNFNNIYICGLPKTSRTASLKYLLPAQKEIIASNIEELKTLTTEVSFLDPIYQAIGFGVRDANGNFNAADDLTNCALQVVKKSTSRRADSSILSDVNNVFIEFFNSSNLALGKTLDYASLITELHQIDGVETYNTVRRIGDAGEEEIVYNGLSFFCWNPTFPTLDQSIITTNRTFNDFQFYYFYNLDTISSKIEILDNSLFF